MARRRTDRGYPGTQSPACEEEVLNTLISLSRPKADTDQYRVIDNQRCQYSAGIIHYLLTQSIVFTQD